jgi:hypothetical protein
VLGMSVIVDKEPPDDEVDMAPSSDRARPRNRDTAAIVTPLPSWTPVLCPALALALAAELGVRVGVGTDGGVPNACRSTFANRLAVPARDLVLPSLCAAVPAPAGLCDTVLPDDVLASDVSPLL